MGRQKLWKMMGCGEVQVKAWKGSESGNKQGAWGAWRGKTTREGSRGTVVRGKGEKRSG